MDRHRPHQRARGVRWSTFDEIADDSSARYMQGPQGRTAMLIQGCGILGFDPDHGSTPYRADMRVEGPLIAEIGEGLIPATGETVLDGRGKLVTPGLLNAHLHSQEALFKGRYDNLPLELWMLYPYPILNARLSPELIYLRTMLVGMEALRNGVTTVVDDVIELPAQSMEQLDAVFRAYDDLGIRANVSGHIINRPFVDTVPFGRHAVPAEVSAQVDAIKLVTEAEYLDYSTEAFSRFHGRSGRLRYVLAPSGPQRVTRSSSRWRSWPVPTMSVPHPRSRDEDAGRDREDPLRSHPCRVPERHRSSR